LTRRDPSKNLCSTLRRELFLRIHRETKKIKSIHQKFIRFINWNLQTWTSCGSSYVHPYYVSCSHCYDPCARCGPCAHYDPYDRVREAESLSLPVNDDGDDVRGQPLFKYQLQKSLNECKLSISFNKFNLEFSMIVRIWFFIGSN
jgi:hypothetical protein